jgi:hypothetical protein
VRAVALLALLLVLAAPAGAAEWAAIDPGRSTTEDVRARFGPATRTAVEKLEGHDAAQWVYEGAQAPPGTRRVVVEFGLVVNGAYRKEVVRALRLEPQPGVWTRRVILNGWGQPAHVAKEGDGDVFVYPQGLLVYFDKEGWDPRLVLFTPPQPVPGGSAPASR